MGNALQLICNKWHNMLRVRREGDFARQGNKKQDEEGLRGTWARPENS